LKLDGSRCTFGFGGGVCGIVEGPKNNEEVIGAGARAGQWHHHNNEIDVSAHMLPSLLILVPAAKDLGPCFGFW
jgi:hypothetical protein